MVSCPAEVRTLASWHEDAGILQESVYSGYIKCNILKILTVTFPSGLIGCLYGSISTCENNNGVLFKLS
jgi:hypothetical protein